MSGMVHRILILLIGVALVGASSFSGFYKPPNEKGVNASGAEDFAAAWLVTKQRLVMAEKEIKSTAKFSMASATFAVVRSNCKGCSSLMTRDFFDYMVEHLSSTSNRIPHGSKLIYNITSGRLRNTVMDLMQVPTHHQDDSRSQDTLGILVFSTRAFSAYTTPEQAGIRVDYFQVTFYSVYRYFNKIDVFVATEEDAALVNSMKLPYRKLTILPTPVDNNKRNPGLVRLALETIVAGIETEWSWVKYFYFTEGDQILHLRTMSRLFDIIDDSNGLFALVPHRMQTFPLRTTFPEATQILFDTQKKSGQTHLPANLEIIVENLSELRGSCCDAGRNVYEPCQTNWWYTCGPWGLANFTQWFRVGRTGLTFPPSTEHKGVCSYSPEKRLCPMPSKCTHRIPWKDEQGVHPVCQQMPIVNFIVNYTAQMEREAEAARAASQFSGMELTLK